jgi:hypothetical protein
VFASAIKMIDAFNRLDPLNGGITLHFLPEAQVSLGQFNEAIATLAERLERKPQFRNVPTLCLHRAMASR